MRASHWRAVREDERALDRRSREEGLRHTGGKPVRPCVLLRTVEASPGTPSNSSSDSSAAAVLLVDLGNRGSIVIEPKKNCESARLDRNEIFCSELKL